MEPKIDTSDLSPARHQLHSWTSTLSRVASQPLEFCPHFPRICQRFEAWWEADLLDRPILIAATNSDPARPITRRLDLLHDADAWWEAKYTDLQQTHWSGDAIPSIRVDFGPVLLGALFGGKTEFCSDTSWTHALVDDAWSNEPDWSIDQNNRWWQLLEQLLRKTAAEAVGRFLVCTPDLGAPADVLLNLRGASQLCLDVLLNTSRMTDAQSAMYDAWKKAFYKLYESTVGEYGAGLYHWYCVWSNRPYHYPACDFSFMIGPKEFQELCLPSIVQQVEAVERSCFHLDGPDSTRHIDALLEIDAIQAIQFTPGAGAPSALPWLAMFEKIQAKGRSLLIYTPAEEVLELCARLRPQGLAFLLDHPPPPREVDLLHETLCSRFGTAN